MTNFERVAFSGVDPYTEMTYWVRYAAGASVTTAGTSISDNSRVAYAPNFASAIRPVCRSFIFNPAAGQTTVGLFGRTDNKNPSTHQWRLNASATRSTRMVVRDIGDL
jgi:hypothetical protein